MVFDGPAAPTVNGLHYATKLSDLGAGRWQTLVFQNLALVADHH